MSLLYRVIYAAHANGTHHKLALDALLELQNPDAEGWRRLILKNAAAYIDGSKAPDNAFKDFKNHVLHVRDGYWGGAIETAGTWYARLVAELKAERWSDAVYSAGVLSHYVVDPIHPFHTGQSDAETNIHRAVEWSISKSYDALRALHPVGHMDLRPRVASGPDWLAALMCASAERANAHYHTLLVHYDFNTGVVDPPAGLDALARSAVAGLIAYASATYAVVLDGAIAEAGVKPPDVSLALDTLLATLSIPRKWILNKIADREERRQVEAMYDELQATGKVDKTLSDDDRTMRDLYQREVQLGETQRQTDLRSERIQSAVLNAAPPVILPQPEPAQPGAATAVASARPPRGPRLAASDDVEAAPSIGPKMAERLSKFGIMTVADLLAAEPEAIAAQLAAHRVDVRSVRAWQDQARLVMTLPGLSGTNAQLLVEAGFRTLDDLGRSTASDVHAALIRCAASAAGERILRGGKAPEIALVAQWIEAATGPNARAA